ncbi:MAG: hypothetical protein JSW41_02670 [Candidatus Aenigmatarchaeota archaeon]|nr:MAG: hypothetical protein JSW41_02670 [Candidatus Aenigmarchaeota archaeon]
MVKKYQLKNVKRNHYHCSASGVRAEALSLEPGLYRFDLSGENLHNVSYMNSGGVIRIPKNQARRIAKRLGNPNEKTEEFPNRIYINLDGGMLHVINPQGVLKIQLDMNYSITTRKYLEGQEDLAEMSLMDLFIDNGIESMVYLPGEVFADEKFERVYRNLSCPSEEGLDLFLRIVKKERNDETTFEPFMGGTGFNKDE